MSVKALFDLARDTPTPWNDDGIIREELFSAERLELHAETLARAQTIVDGTPRGHWLHQRLSANEALLLSAYRTLAAAVGQGSSITPAAEWLIDNYHLVEEQIRQISDDLPPKFYRQLPKLASGPFAGFPRVFGMAWACIAHSDSHFEPETLRRFVRAYQRVSPLTIGELWAVSITLRVVLIENLRRVVERIVSGRAARLDADEVADRLLGVNGAVRDPMALRDRHGQASTLSPAFVVQIVKRLRDQDPRVTPALVWLEDQLALQGKGSDAIVHDEHARQGASNVTVRNIITSMRLITDVNWPEFFEDVSLVDGILREGSDFAAMDFATRNLYRSAIENLARGSRHSEHDIARLLVQPPDDADATPAPGRDPGFHLIGAGLQVFADRIGFQPAWRERLSRQARQLGAPGYIAAIGITAATVLALALSGASSRGAGALTLALLGAAGLVPALDAAVALVNRILTRRLGATLLPGLALKDGIPPELRTLVVMPALLTTPAAIAELLDALEVHCLASADGELYFALLTDDVDAMQEQLPADAALLAAAATGIARLNLRHPAGPAGPRFLLLHRRRRFSAGQRQWMGWERKRGKLHELNRLLRGATDTSFASIDGVAPAVPAEVRYVITLDADTRLPREAAVRLVGKLAHPLNHPQRDPRGRRVVAGYAVLQPRVTASLPIGREGSLFQRVFSSMTGIDPYDSAVSDIYQDLFGEGSYSGKGIYDVDAFEAALDGRVPDGSLLSHDLFEGTFARAGLVSDIEVIEEFPSRYEVAAARGHRWTRGDWQLLPWLFGRRDAARRDDAGMPLLARWKMFDNLRRSLSAPAALAALLAGWWLAPGAAVFWTGFVLGTIALPALLPILSTLAPRRRGLVARSHLRALADDLAIALLQIGFGLAFLAHQSWLMGDAILRTLFRMFVSHRNLLEWTTSAQLVLAGRTGAAGYYRFMSGGVCLALGALLLLVASATPALWVALPFVFVWLAAPGLAEWSSLSPAIAGHLPTSAPDVLALRLVARRTWRYFETFVTREDNDLPPDNFQEVPLPTVAHRTSPTNIGLYLLCVVSARDFGWISTSEAARRLADTVATMRRLGRCRGHFYNWYDTRDLRPLEPAYVSSVDSGNLAAHLIALANACGEWPDRLIDLGAVRRGIRDAMALLRHCMADLTATRTVTILAFRQVEQQIRAVEAALASPDTDGLAAWLARLAFTADALHDAVRELVDPRDDAGPIDLLYWAKAVGDAVASWQQEAGLEPDARHRLEAQLAALADEVRTMALDMQFGFLLDPERRLLSIGFRADDGSLDPNCYDLLASEARLASFFAIAKNDVPVKHWFRLGRAVTPIGHGAALISWSGSMFEYLMPSLVMRAPAGSLLEQTSRLIVRRQIAYGAANGVPWGVSESAYNARDLEMTYQYSNFGVPGLGLKRGLGENLVIAPYATGLAAMVDPEAAARNFQALARAGALGRHGFYEALDYTRSRLPEGAGVAIVRAYMAHHQGMTIVSIANLLFDGRMRARFHAEASIRATELLLQERTPRDVAIAHPRAEEVKAAPREESLRPAELRRVHGANHATPETHLLSNGRYAVMLTAAGSGYSRWGELGITRWREDATRDDCGSYLFLRDVEGGEVWSAGCQPCGVEPDSYSVTFTEDRVEYLRTDGKLATLLQVVVSPEDDAECRRLSITNTGPTARVIEVTSYCELVLAPPAADTAHPAFSKLFVQTEYLPKLRALLATRRARSSGDAAVWVAHNAVVEDAAQPEVEYETDRARFVGRGREIKEPVAVTDARRLSNTTGTVLDPVFALRCRVTVPPGGTTRIAFWTSAAGSREAVLDLLDRHHDANAYVRAATLSWTQAQVQLRHLGVTHEEANLFQEVMGHILYANAALRPSSATIDQGAAAQPNLWSQGISGDVPIVLLRVDDIDDLPVVRQLLQAHEYWRMKRVAVDLVILNERGASYVQDLQVAIETAVRTSQSRSPAGTEIRRGSVFVLRTDLITAPLRSMLSAVARVVLVGKRGSLADQVERRVVLPVVASGLRPGRDPEASHPPRPVPFDLEFFNGAGGFAEDGREYVTWLEAGQRTPAPWINVIANPLFGFQVSAEGGGYTWSVNSRENQLTQWSNDPVTDRPSEVLYLRDEETGDVWCPTALPVRNGPEPYCARHGQGYSRFEHAAHALRVVLTVFVPSADPVKISRLRITNRSGRRRTLSVTAYLEWVLGTARAASAPFITTTIDTATGALFAQNPWSAVYGSRVAFGDLAGEQTQWTADRREFLGRHGGLDQPAALASFAALSGRTGAGLDPCCALRTEVVIEPGETREVVFFLGETGSAAEARTLIARYRSADLDAVLREVTDYWDDVLGTIQVSTPDRSMDVLLNRWALYQTLVCRIWARSAFYQSSGAYGFRDQLQDGMAIVHARPALTRAHLLRAAGRQFPEGDVQHWWLPPTGQGVRTRISDDRIWLAFACQHYLAATGDLGVLDEEVGFLDGARLEAGQHDAYFLPGSADLTASFHEHCARGLDDSLALGAHGLPLIGTGDWNDGMNRVGEAGRGESVWLGWFLYATLTAYAPVAAARGEAARSQRWIAHAAALRDALDTAGWDGAWYRRGYFDDGTPLGSAGSEECRIDSIAQSWSVLSGAADPARAAQAMAQADAQLVMRQQGIALLFTPPFDRTALDPGYVKGYPPGLRENGGQYTHAAAWSVLAYTRLGAGDQAAGLFSLLNPINHASTRAGVRRYRVEPYVVAADVYSVPPHVGRGGWTWYTGSAGWLYRSGVEGILGFHKRGNHLDIAPCIPGNWPGFRLSYRHGTARYDIEVVNPEGVSCGVLRIERDGVLLASGRAGIDLVDDGNAHHVRVTLGA